MVNVYVMNTSHTVHMHVYRTQPIHSAGEAQ